MIVNLACISAKPLAVCHRKQSLDRWRGMRRLRLWGPDNDDNDDDKAETLETLRLMSLIAAVALRNWAGMVSTMAPP